MSREYRLHKVHFCTTSISYCILADERYTFQAAIFLTRTFPSVTSSKWLKEQASSVYFFGNALNGLLLTDCAVAVCGLMEAAAFMEA